MTTPVATTQLRLLLPNLHPASFRFELYTDCLFQATFEQDNNAGFVNGRLQGTPSSGLRISVSTAEPFPSKAVGSVVSAKPAFVVRNTGGSPITLGPSSNPKLPTGHTR